MAMPVQLQGYIPSWRRQVSSIGELPSKRTCSPTIGPTSKPWTGDRSLRQSHRSCRFYRRLPIITCSLTSDPTSPRRSCPRLVERCAPLVCCLSGWCGSNLRASLTSSSVLSVTTISQLQVQTSTRNKKLPRRVLIPGAKTNGKSKSMGSCWASWRMQVMDGRI